MSKRRLAWQSALRDLKNDRLNRQEVREERLRVRWGAGPQLSAWRGRSGRRYVVVVYPIAEAAALADRRCVGLVVRRDAEGLGSIVAAGSLSRLANHGLSLIACGGNEIHVHNLADTDDERRAFVEDLGSDLPPMQHQAPPARPIVTVG